VKNVATLKSFPERTNKAPLNEKFICESGCVPHFGEIEEKELTRLLILSYEKRERKEISSREVPNATTYPAVFRVRIVYLN
jgi:hypothetical protein